MQGVTAHARISSLRRHSRQLWRSSDSFLRQKKTMKVRDDSFLWSDKWKFKRRNILRRDEYTDQYLLKTQGIMRNADTVHHILPREQFPQYALCDWNLISLSSYTHSHIIHNCVSGALTKEGKKLMMETALLNGVKLTEKVLVIGLPGSGKTSYVQSVLSEDAIAYDLDAIAGAFRLRGPHEEDHKASRRMANSLFKAFALRAQEFAPRVFLIRSAPKLEELAEIKPDRVVICSSQYDISSRADKIYYDLAEMRKRIRDIKTFCEKNSIEIESPPGCK